MFILRFSLENVSKWVQTGPVVREIIPCYFHKYDIVFALDSTFPHIANTGVRNPTGLAHLFVSLKQELQDVRRYNVMSFFIQKPSSNM